MFDGCPILLYDVYRDVLLLEYTDTQMLHVYQLITTCLELKGSYDFERKSPKYLPEPNGFMILMNISEYTSQGWLIT